MKTIKLLTMDLASNEIKNISGGGVMTHELEHPNTTQKRDDVIDDIDSWKDDWFDIMCIGLGSSD